MRVTNNMLISNMVNTLNLNLERMDELQTQLSTGKKISKPSDDPIVASKALRLRTDVAEISQYQKNVEDATSWASTTDSTLGSISSILQSARELAVQAANGTNSTQNEQAMAQQAQQYYQELIKLSNATYAGRYIFSGYSTDKELVLDQNQSFTYTNVPVLSSGGPPANTFRLKHDNVNFAGAAISGKVGGTATTFTVQTTPPTASGQVQLDTTTGKLTFFGADVAAGITNLTASYTLNRNAGDYNPDAYCYTSTTQTAPMQGEDINYDIGVSDSININVIGSKVFGDAASGSNQGTNLANFSKFINALNTNNQAGIQQAISDIDSFNDSVLQQRADIGARENRLELTKNRLNDANTNFTDLMSKNEDADVAQVILNLQNAQNVYNASLGAGAKIIQPTLLDFLK